VTAPVHVSHPYQAYPRLCFARVAARSEAFVAAGTEPTDPDADLLVGAAAGVDEAQVRVRALGELTERMSDILAGRRLEKSHPREFSFADLAGAGTRAVDPRAWPELADVPGIERRPMVWAAGVSLVHGAEVLVPACAAHLRHRPPTGGRPAMGPGSAGLSAHRTVELARRHALLEVLERDLIWRAWYDHGPRRLARCPDLGPELSALRLERTVLLLPGPGGTACVAVCLADPSGGRQSFGARTVAAGDRCAPAVEVATHEALMVRWSMDTPSARTHIPDPAASPRGPLEHALHTFHQQDSLGHLLARAEPAPPDPAGADLPRTDPDQADSEPAGQGDTDLARLLADHTGEDVIWVDSTTPGVSADPDRRTVVGRVVAPGARRLPGSEDRLPARLRGHLPHPLG
jgi:ribosomal protein S12 methylthiotransferase accessory factor